jgi:hypothetical protein
MYTITHARRSTYQRPQAEARGRGPGPPVRCAPSRHGRSARVSDRGRLCGGGWTNGPRRCAPAARQSHRTASHKTGARDLRAALRGVWTQPPAPPTAATMRRGQRINLFQLSTETDQPHSVASGRQENPHSQFFNRAGSTFAAKPCFGPENGVHPREQEGHLQ